MKTFNALYELAAVRKGGAGALEKLIPTPKSQRALQRVTDDRWLSAMTRCVFQAGFSWKVVENKWPGFEEVYAGFNPAFVASMSDEQCEALVEDKRIIRQWRKIKATRHNAQFVCDLAQEFGSAASFFANFPSTDFISLLGTLKTRGAWLGGTTAQYFLRTMGKDSFVLSRDVESALRREGVITGGSSSKSAREAIQAAFNTWVEQGGQTLTRVSRVLAFTVES